jgi:hypothetical protein
MHWLHFWSHLESDEKDKKMFTSAYQQLEVVIMQIFVNRE